MDSRTYVKKWQLTIPNQASYDKFIKNNPEFEEKLDNDKTIITESDNNSIMMTCTFLSQQYGSTLGKWFVNTGITFRPHMTIIEETVKKGV